MRLLIHLFKFLFDFFTSIFFFSYYYRVYNVRQISIDFLKCKFNNYKDHSKYAVSIDEEKPWVCIGDINRAVSVYNKSLISLCII